jgi:glycine amidinotransferase
MKQADKKSQPVVNSYNEWDPLEEVIVGIVDGAYVPVIDQVWHASLPEANALRIFEAQGRPYRRSDVGRAQQEIDHFVRVLEAEGVVVRRPLALDFSRPFSTPDWGCTNGFCAANPRDLLLVVGDEIIETPCASRSRYFEVHAYRPLLREYFRHGAKWTSAPKPTLREELFDREYRRPKTGSNGEYPITEYEPTFDAADFVRCGRDLFVTRSVVTNRFGIDWLARHLGPMYTIHEVQTLAVGPMHIDTTLLLLAPGKALVNREFAPNLPDALRGWEIIEAPKPRARTNADSLLAPSSSWLSINVLSLDEQRVIVEAEQHELIRLLGDHGLRPIPVPFQNVFTFGAGFHCATLDIRRRGELRSYC